MTERNTGNIDAIMIARSDNVATCLNDIAVGEQVSVKSGKDVVTVKAERVDAIEKGGAHFLGSRDLLGGVRWQEEGGQCFGR